MSNGCSAVGSSEGIKYSRIYGCSNASPTEILRFLIELLVWGISFEVFLDQKLLPFIWIHHQNLVQQINSISGQAIEVAVEVSSITLSAQTFNYHSH